MNYSDQPNFAEMKYISLSKCDLPVFKFYREGETTLASAKQDSAE